MSRKKYSVIAFLFLMLDLKRAAYLYVLAAASKY